MLSRQMANVNAGQGGRMMPLIYKRERAPTPRPIRWTATQRAAVVLAVASGRLPIGDLERRYGISLHEFHDWQEYVATSARPRGGLSFG